MRMIEKLILIQYYSNDDNTFGSLDRMELSWILNLYYFTGFPQLVHEFFSFFRQEFRGCIGSSHKKSVLCDIFLDTFVN